MRTVSKTAGSPSPHGETKRSTEQRHREIHRTVDRLITLKIQADDIDPAQWAKIGVLVGVKRIRAAVVRGINEGKS